MRAILFVLGLGIVAGVTSCSKEVEISAESRSWMSVEPRLNGSMTECWSATEAVLTERGYNVEVQGYLISQDDVRQVSKALATKPDAKPIEITLQPFSPSETDVAFKVTEVGFDTNSEGLALNNDTISAEIGPIIAAVRAKLE